MSFAQRIIEYHRNLEPTWPVPAGVDLLFPYEQPETLRVLAVFYEKYYSDDCPRTGLFGINPGRFGAGVTGVPFTDPIRLEEEVSIPNDFDKKPELSSLFVYEVVNAWGGPAAFFGRFYITSLSPLGFTKEGRNYNYYDDQELCSAVEPLIIHHLRAQLDLGLSPRKAFCLGQGKNWSYFRKLNDEYGFFETIVPLPHPRWVMQYRRGRVSEFVDLYLKELLSC